MVILKTCGHLSLVPQCICNMPRCRQCNRPVTRNGSMKKHTVSWFKSLVLSHHDKKTTTITPINVVSEYQLLYYLYNEIISQSMHDTGIHPNCTNLLFPDKGHTSMHPLGEPVCTGIFTSGCKMLIRLLKVAQCNLVSKAPINLLHFTEHSYNR